jgi:hypothetical protein
MEIVCSGKKAPEIFGILKGKLTRYVSEGKLQMNKVEFTDASYEALATGTGYKAKIRCQDGKLVVDLELNFLLKAMRGQIEEGIKNTLKKALA